MGVERRRVRVGNLPVEVNRFVGRLDEAGRIKGLLGEGRLVTLIGAGGVGKTRLALHVAGEVGRAFGGRVWLVELAELTDPGLLAHAVAGQLDMPNTDGGDVIGALVEHLGAEPVLLVVDNCEHLVDAVAKLVDRVLREAAGVTVLATSREALGIDGEVSVAVAPLAVPDPAQVTSAAAVLAHDGASLLVERTKAVLPGFAVDQHNYLDVALLCQWLEGIPLAIELAAARLRSLAVDEIVDRLDDRYRLLTLGSRSSPARHQTLRATVEWSYQLCSPAERALWARAAVFPGGFELDAAIGICGLPEDEVLDVLASLVDKSILVLDGSRYVMLEAIREFGLRILEPHELAESRRRHRDWHIGLIDRLAIDYARGDQVAALDRQRRERGNLRIALEFCATVPGEATAGLRLASRMLNHWMASSSAEGAQWLDRLLDIEPTPSRERAMALCDRAWLPLRPDGPTPTDYLDEADQIIAGLGLEQSIEAAQVLRTRAVIDFNAGRHAAAAEQFTEVVNRYETFRPTSEWERAYVPFGLLNTRSALALTYSSIGDLARAEALLRQELPVAVEQGNAVQASMMLWNLGMLELERGDTDSAHALGKESLQWARDLGDQYTEFDAIQLLGFVAAARGRADDAAWLFGAADERVRAGSGVSFGDWEAAIGRRYRDQARAALGATAYEAAYQAGAETGQQEAIARALGEVDSGPTPSPAVPVLTRRESEIAGLVAKGMTNRAIADALVISVRTVETHVDHILTKLGFTSRAQIASWFTATARH